MPRKKIQKITAWSFSRYSTYVKCALLAYYKFILKLKEPKPLSTSPLGRGKIIHKEAELYSTGQTKRMPASLELFADEFKALRKVKKKLQVEQQLACDRDWEQSDWFDGSTWFRAVLDCMYVDGDTLVVIDYKTGKLKQEVEQLELYAIIGFIYGPEHITKVRCEFWFLDQGEIVPEQGAVFTRAEALKLRKLWVKKTKKMLADGTFAPNPGDACRWCFFKKSNGGPCKF